MVTGVCCCGVVALAAGPAWASIRDQLSPSYPSIPSDYNVLAAGKMVAQAQVDFPAYYVDRTNGFRVTAPDGREFVVDNVEDPKCAFYGTYINTDDNGLVSPGAGVTINSSVYVGEINFENCQ